MSTVATALSGLHKAAILMVCLGDGACASLLKRLNEDEVRALMGMIAELPPITEDQSAAVLQEFRLMVEDPSFRRKGGVDFAKRVLTTAFGPEESQRHLERMPQKSANESAQGLRKLDPATLARFVETEHPQTVALVLSHLGAAQSAAVLGSMDVERRTQVTLRLARLDQVAPAATARIWKVISKKFQKFGELRREATGGLRTVAEIFNQMDSEMTADVLDRLSELDGSLVEAIRQKMFVFEDLLALDSEGVKELLGRADRRALTVALKGAGDELRKHLLQSMSQRGSAMLLEDLEALGPVKVRDVEAAQQELIRVVRQLETEGVINLKGGGGDEQYIV